MAQGSLGTASLVLSAAYGPLQAGLNRSWSLIRAFTDKVRGAKELDDKGQFTGKRVGGLLGDGGVMSQVASGGVKAGKLLAGGLAAGLLASAGLVAAAIPRLGELAAQGSAATAFGVSAEQFTGMAGLAASAGSDIRDFTEALTTLTGRSAEAASGTGVAAEMFGRLGLSAGEFGKLNPADQFYGMFEAINRLENPTERVRTLMQAFGEDSAKNLIPLLGKSRQELEGLAGQYSKSAADIAAAQLASESMSRAQAAVSTGFDGVVIAMAPVLEFAAELIPAALQALGPTFSGLGQYVMPVLRGVTHGFGYLWEVVKIGAGVLVGIASKAVQSVGVITDLIGYALDMAKELPDAIRPSWVDAAAQGAHDLGRDIERLGQGMERWAGNTIDNTVSTFGASAAAADQFFTDFEKRRELALRKHVAQLKGVTAAAGKDGPLKANEKLFAEAAARGSKEEYSARVRFQFGGLGQAGKDQLAEQRRTTAAVKELNKTTAGLGDKLTAPPAVVDIS